MYSIVVMMAMSTSPEAVAFGKHKAGCNGCYGSMAYAGCTGSAYTGGYAPAYTGCTGYSSGYSSGCMGYSSGYSSGCMGYSSGCMGCSGGGHKMFGGKGCSGGMFSGGFCGGRKHGNSCSGGYGCSGSYGSAYTGCTGGYAPAYTGCTGGYAAPYMSAPGSMDMTAPVTTPPVIVPAPKKEMPKGGTTSAPATITLNVPADAKVTIDGAATTSTSSVRVFSTPMLAVGNTYTYTFVAEVVREGKVLTASKQIVVIPGTTAQVELNPAVSATVAAR